MKLIVILIMSVSLIVLTGQLIKNEKHTTYKIKENDMKQVVQNEVQHQPIKKNFQRIKMEKIHEND